MLRRRSKWCVFTQRPVEKPTRLSCRIWTVSITIRLGPLVAALIGTLDSSEIVQFASSTGAVCELDLFGNEVSYYELSDDFDMPNDSTRIELLKALIGNGYGDQITISHDIHTKHRLVKHLELTPYGCTHCAFCLLAPFRCISGDMASHTSYLTLSLKWRRKESLHSRLIKFLFTLLADGSHSDGVQENIVQSGLRAEMLINSIALSHVSLIYGIIWNIKTIYI